MLYPLATLAKSKLTAIQALEKELGTPVVALAGLEAEAPALKQEQLAKLQELEEELGVVLVAVRPS